MCVYINAHGLCRDFNRTVRLSVLLAVGAWTSKTKTPYHIMLPQICLDDRPASEAFVLSACGHSFCRACLRAYVVSKVTDGQVTQSSLCLSAVQYSTKFVDHHRHFSLGGRPVFGRAREGVG